MLNVSKVTVAGALLGIGIYVHIPPHALGAGDRKESLPLIQRFVPYFGWLPLIFLGYAWLVGQAVGGTAMQGPWTLTEAAAAVVAFLALGFRWWGMRTLQSFFTFAVGVRKNHKLIREGPYRWVRHPAYAGTLLYFTAAAFFFGRSMFAWLPVMLVWCYITWNRVRLEERVLLDAFGKECEAHFKATWRLFPYLF